MALCVLTVVTEGRKDLGAGSQQALPPGTFIFVERDKEVPNRAKHSLGKRSAEARDPVCTGTGGGRPSAAM